jgi:hypothetical protein
MAGITSEWTAFYHMLAALPQHVVVSALCFDGLSGATCGGLGAVSFSVLPDSGVHRYFAQI